MQNSKLSNTEINKKDKSIEKLNDSPDEINDELLLASNKQENIRIGKWYNGKLSLNKLLSKKYEKGYCQPPKNTKKNIDYKYKENDDEDMKGEEITLENFKPNNCSGSITPSKGGYKRPQLKNFAIKYLKIPYTQLEKEKNGEITTLTKKELCKIINTKYREIITQTYGSSGITDKMRKDIYVKEIDNCENGEAKGGYSIIELKNMAINYFNLSEDEAKTMKKPELCKHIRKILNKIDYDEEHKNSLIDKTDKTGNDNDDDNDDDNDKNIDINNNENAKDDNLNYIYKGDINNCVDSPNRGGINLKELKKIAVYNFGINVNSKLKEEICSDIKYKLNENKNKINFKTDKKNVINMNKSNKTTFNDLLKNIDYEEDELESSAIKDEEDEEDEDESEEDEDKISNYEISDVIYSKKSLADFDDDEE